MTWISCTFKLFWDNVRNLNYTAVWKILLPKSVKFFRVPTGVLMLLLLAQHRHFEHYLFERLFEQYNKLIQGLDCDHLICSGVEKTHLLVLMRTSWKNMLFFTAPPESAGVFLPNNVLVGTCSYSQPNPDCFVQTIKLREWKSKNLNSKLVNKTLSLW